MKMSDNTILIHETNYLYAEIINCNNKIYKLKNTQIPKRFLNYENQLLQNKIDKLIGDKKDKSKINSLWFNFKKILK
jgi:DNA-directed RNA polymerase beta' subunit